MAKTCTCGCNGPVFSKGVCQSTWRRLYQKPINRTPIAKNGKAAVKKQSTKEKKIKNELSAVKKEIELTAVQNNEYYCQGCGCSYVGLDKSHILSVGLYKHLELVPENIQLMCRRCHDIWENRGIEERITLYCFEKNMEIIYKYDQEAWRKLNTEVDAYLHERLCLN